MSIIERLADDFFAAFYQKCWSGDEEQDDVGELSHEESYEVQDQVAEKRVEYGEQVVGYKVGCTSRAIRRQFGLGEPIYGRLFAPHTRECVSELDWKGFANCAIEPEMVIQTSSDLSGMELSEAQLIAAIDSIRPGIELHDFTFWRQPATTQELICSGGIHAGLLIGAEDRVSADRFDWQEERFLVCRDGKEIAIGRASEIMGGPLNSLRWLVRKLTQRGRVLPAGSLVIPGSPVELIVIDSNCLLEVHIGRVGSCRTWFRKA